MSRKTEKDRNREKWYAVLTLTGCTVTRTWEEALQFLKANPGPEKHKKFYSEEEALEFIEENKDTIAPRKQYWESLLYGREYNKD